MLLLTERTLSGLLVMAGAQDPFVDVSDPYQVDADELVSFLQHSRWHFAFTRQDNQIVGVSQTAAGVVNHTMTVTGTSAELDDLFARVQALSH